MPYSCQLQFATSGKVVTPVGGARTCLGMGREISHTSTFTIVQTIIRSPFGRLSFGRSMIAEYFERSRGKVIRGFTFRFQDCGQLLPLVVSSRTILGIASRSFILLVRHTQIPEVLSELEIFEICSTRICAIFRMAGTAARNFRLGIPTKTS